MKMAIIYGAVLLFLLTLVNAAPIFAEKEAVIPDLSKFERHYSCKDDKINPPRVLQDNYNLFDGTGALYNEYVFLTTITKTSVQLMLYVQDGFRNGKTPKKYWHRIELFAKIGDKWQTVKDKNKFLELMRRHIPKKYIADDNRLVPLYEKFVCVSKKP